MKVKKIISGETNSNNIKLINLSRNFGHHKALMTGINFSKGEFIFLLESDLEEDPEWLKDLYNKLIETGLMLFTDHKKTKGKFI